MFYIMFYFEKEKRESENETIAKYDMPAINGVTGMRPYKKSAFCSKSSVKQAFESLFHNLQSKYAIVSYNN